MYSSYCQLLAQVAKVIRWFDYIYTTKDLALSDPAHYSAEQVWIVSNRLGNADFHVDQCLYVICVSVFVRGWARMLVRAFHFLRISVPNGLLHWFSYYVYANSGFWYPYVTFLSWKISYFWKTCKNFFGALRNTISLLPPLPPLLT